MRWRIPVSEDPLSFWPRGAAYNLSNRVRRSACSRATHPLNASRSLKAAARSHAKAPMPKVFPLRTIWASRGWHGKVRHCLSMRGDAALGIECAKGLKELARPNHGPGRRRIQPEQFLRIGNAPLSQFQGKGSQVGIQNFRRGARGEDALLASDDNRTHRPGSRRPARPRVLFGRLL